MHIFPGYIQLHHQNWILLPQKHRLPVSTTLLLYSRNPDPWIHHIQNWLLQQHSLRHIIHSPNENPVHPEFCSPSSHPHLFMGPQHPFAPEPPSAPCPTTDEFKVHKAYSQSPPKSSPLLPHRITPPPHAIPHQGLWTEGTYNTYV